MPECTLGAGINSSGIVGRRTSIRTYVPDVRVVTGWCIVCMRLKLWDRSWETTQIWSGLRFSFVRRHLYELNRNSFTDSLRPFYKQNKRLVFFFFGIDCEDYHCLCCDAVLCTGYIPTFRRNCCRALYPRSWQW